MVAVYGIVNDVTPSQMAGLALLVSVGKALTVTLPFMLLEVQPFAFLRSVHKKYLPPMHLLKFTVIGLAVKVPSVTVVIPVPEIE